MDHVTVLKQKLEDLRTEIAQLHMLNQQFRREKKHDAAGQMDDMRRQSRLQEIQQELARLAALGRAATSLTGRNDQRPGKPFLVKKAS